MTSILSETNLTREQRQYLETIRISGESLLTVINDILDFSKIESGMVELDYTDFDLCQCVEEVMDLFAMKASQQNIDLIYEVDDRVPALIIGDGHRLRQVLINLLGNALKFTKKGEIFVSAKILAYENDTISLAFSVRDTGIGIPEDKLSRLFKAFSQVDSSTTRKYGGTGLGLVISQKLIELMGGEITVQSEEGKGTTFAFDIACEVSKKQPSQKEKVYTDKLKGLRVLVVDDNLTYLSILEKQLSSWKIIPKMVSSGGEAIKILKEDAKSYDVVITDMYMPGMDGVELGRAIKEINPQLPIILITPIGDGKKEELEALFAAVVPKPVKPRRLHQHLLEKFGGSKEESAVSEHQGIMSPDFGEKYPLRILIAEDNLVNQKVATLVLKKLGYEPEQATNGKLAVDKFREKFYDVILMDVQMPEMDGLEATRTIRLLQNEQPVIIAMTANAMREDKEACLEAGMDDYISKPFKPEDLKTALEKAYLSKMHADG